VGDVRRPLRRDPGQTTLLAGDTEIVIKTSVTPHTLLGAVRTYRIAGTGAVIAVRSALPGKSGVDYELTDPHGTATLEMDTATQAVSRTQYTPYGQVRGTTSSTWIDPTRGYLGQPTDTTTGYTDLGARKYDPSLGRFISVDPALETNDPRQLGGYTYAGDNPVTSSDPTGLRACLDSCETTPPPTNGNGGHTGNCNFGYNADGSCVTTSCDASCQLSSHEQGKAVLLGSYVLIDVNDPNLAAYEEMWQAELARDPDALELIKKQGDRPDLEGMMWLNACHASGRCSHDFEFRMVGLYNGIGA